MREIKFRGQTITGEWVYGLLSKPTSGKYAGKTFISNSVGMPFAYEVRPETVGQFTGLKDKNEKEIYEGDRLSVIDPNGYEIQDNFIVKWDNNACTYPFEADFGDYDLTSIGWAMQMEYDFEVIGNIYENQNLISE